MSEFRTGFFFGIAFGILAITSVIGITHNVTTRSFQESAIEANVAEYYIDSEHEKQFRYLEFDTETKD